MLTGTISSSECLQGVVRFTTKAMSPKTDRIFQELNAQLILSDLCDANVLQFRQQLQRTAGIAKSPCSLHLEVLIMSLYSSRSKLRTGDAVH